MPNCINCNIEFIKKSNRHKYCSSSCNNKYLYKLNKKKHNQKTKNWNKSNPDYAKEWRIKNKDRLIKWRADNREELNFKKRIKYKEIYSKNKIKLKLRRKKYLETNPHAKLAHNCRKRISALFKAKGIKKSLKTIELLGCTTQEAKRHLELQFKPGMTWDNHKFKGWHIDHIIPCAAFDLNDPEQQKKCFHYTNLQPLWWWENLSKGARV